MTTTTTTNKYNGRFGGGDLEQPKIQSLIHTVCNTKDANDYWVRQKKERERERDAKNILLGSVDKKHDKNVNQRPQKSMKKTVYMTHKLYVYASVCVDEKARNKHTSSSSIKFVAGQALDTIINTTESIIVKKDIANIQPTQIWT